MFQNLIRYTSVRALLVIAALGLGAGTALAAEGTAQKAASTSDGYCNLKIPAARPSTLPNDKAELKSSTTGDAIDYYGPCNIDPTSKDETASQRQAFGRKYTKF